MLGSNSDVEDIAQQVFIRVWKSARRYVPQAKFTTWLLKITRNLVFNELRRAKRHAHVPLHPEAGAEDPPLKDETNLTPDASLLEGELQRTIEAAILQLPETQRMALVLQTEEEPQRTEDQCQTQHSKNGTNKTIDGTEQKRGAQQTAQAVAVTDSDNRRSHKHGNCGRDPAENKMSDASEVSKFTPRLKKGE